MAELRHAGPYIQDYLILQTTKEEDVMRAIRNGLQGAGIPVENSKGEWGPGQEEINVRYADALEMADRHVILKNGMQGDRLPAWARRSPSWRSGITALAGYSSHIHAFAVEHGREERRSSSIRRREFGMSALMRQFVAGQLKYAGDITWFLAPYINSYKRFQVGTFAPTKAIWSRDNRTAGFRLCGEGTKAIRIECRIGGADLNPYLAFAALIAAGLAGIDEKLELPSRSSATPTMGRPSGDSEDAARGDRTFAESKMLREALGGDVVEHYVHTAQWEQFEYDRRITDWELKRGFERY